MKDKDLRMVAAILETSTIRAAAERAGIGEATMYRRLSERDFQARLREARHQAFGQSLARLQAASGRAVDALSAIMGNEHAPTGARVRSAVAVLQLAGRDLERGGVQDRLEGNAKEDAVFRGDKGAFLRAGGTDQEYFTHRAACGLFE